MIHVFSDSMAFNLPNKKFNVEKIYKSFSYIGSIKKGQYLAPVGCNAISNSKTNSIKKAFSESIERKSLMAGGASVDVDGYTPTFDLIKNEISNLENVYTSYRLQKPHISDTTGTAVHFNSQTAIQKALEELLEKNALFLFWYGKQGWKLDEEMYHEHPFSKQILASGYNMMVFLNKSFTDLYTVIVIIFKDKHVVSSGISASLYFNRALDAAIEEAYLLKWEQNGLEFRSENSFLSDNAQHLDYLNQYNYIGKNSEIFTSIYNSESDLNNLIKCIPKWVSNLHVIVLKNTTENNLISIKLFSKDLYNHLPQKQVLDLEQTINKKTINITENEMKNICDCIIR